MSGVNHVGKDGAVDASDFTFDQPCRGLNDEFVTVLGADWFLLFMAPEVHHTSAVKALRCF
ncbi:unnamed protein product, partial [Dibothriocephalus latus]